MPLGFLHAQEFNLNIKGKDSVETKVIDSVGYQKSHSSYKSIAAETDTLLYKLQKTGYVDALHSPIQKQNDSVFAVKFQLKQEFKTLKIQYPKNLFDPKLLKKISNDFTGNYFTIPIVSTEKVLEFLNTTIANRGKPFNTLQLSEIKKDNKGGLEATLIKNKTQTRTIDSIVVKGYDKFPRAFLKNFIKLKKGQAFNKAKLDKKTEELKNLAFVKSRRNPEVLFTKDKTTLYLYLEKQNSNHFEGFLGFSTDEETKNLQLDGNINLNLVNNLNFGESLNIKYKNNGEDQQHFNAELELPNLFQTPFGLKLELDLFRQDTTFTTNSQSANLTYQINSKLKLATGYQGSASNFLLDETTAVAGQVNEDYNAKFFTLGGNYLVRNPENALTPITTNLDLTLGIGKRTRENAESAQQKLEFIGKHIFDIDLRNSIFVANQTAVLLSDDYLENELFRFGGINSLRGFEENSLLASFYSSFQTEYRYLLSQNLYANSIIDYARSKNSVQNTQNNLYGIGFGLGLKTNAGLLKLAFANGKTDGQAFKFGNTKVHLSLTASF